MNEWEKKDHSITKKKFQISDPCQKLLEQSQTHISAEGSQEHSLKFFNMKRRAFTWAGPKIQGKAYLHNAI